MIVCLECIQQFLRKQNPLPVQSKVDLIQLDNPLTGDQIGSGSAKPGGQRMLEVGELKMPHMLIEQLEVFVDSEKIYGNDQVNLISRQF